jgi:diguanylate cyclase (GGDEF)-like protein
LNIQASLGISLFPDHGATAESLLQNADRAMYRSKQAGCNAVTVAAAES